MKVLFIDDEVKDEIVFLSEGLAKFEFEVIGEEFSENALKRIKECKPDVVLLDVMFHGDDKGKSALAQIKKAHPKLPVVMLTSTLLDRSMIDTKDYPGASYFFAKQELNLKKNPNCYKDLAEQLNRVIADVNTNADYQVSDEELGFVVGSTQRMQDIAQTILKVAPMNATVLITGESGTGKGVVAQAIHNLSKRKGFLPIHCGAITETLLESELFGTTRGAGTNSVNRAGYFEATSGGTVFLDEVEAMSEGLQAKLLRVLREGQIIRVGSTRVVNVDVRVIAATNRDLKVMVNQGKFREDLYNRLNVVNIKMPPLRDRIGDIPLLYGWAINKLNKAHATRFSESIQDRVLELFQSYSWPGNIGEFEKSIEAAMVTARAHSNVLTSRDFRLGADSPAESGISINIPDVVNNILEGTISWDNLQNIQGDSRKNILLALIERLKIKNGGKRPKRQELAAILKVKDSNMGRILSNADIELREI